MIAPFRRVGDALFFWMPRASPMDASLAAIFRSRPLSALLQDSRLKQLVQH